MGLNILKAATNPMAAAKEAIMKIDVIGEKGKPDIIEALDGAEAGLLALADFLDDVDADEAEGILRALNNFRRPDRRKSEAEIKAAALAVVAVPPAIRKLEKFVEQAEAELLKK